MPGKGKGGWVEGQGGGGGGGSRGGGGEKASAIELIHLEMGGGRKARKRQKLQIKLSTSPYHSILTPFQPVPAQTLERQAPGRVANGVLVPTFKLLV